MSNVTLCSDIVGSSLLKLLTGGKINFSLAEELETSNQWFCSQFTCVPQAPFNFLFIELGYRT